MITLQEFIDKWNGKGIDFDGHYGFQCVDLYRQYVQDVLGVPQSPGVSGAKDIWDTYLTEYYDRIPNTPDGFPLPGDIMIWGAKYGPYGHVAVVTQADTNTFTCFSQNDPQGTLAGLKTYKAWSALLGWLHPIKNDTTYKGYDLTNKDSMKVAVDVLVQLQSGELVKKEDVANLQKQIDDLKKSQEDLSKMIEELRLSIGEKDKEISISSRDVRVLKADNQKLQEDLDYYKPYKSRYEEALNKIPNSLTSAQLFSIAWKKFWEERKKK